MSCATRVFFALAMAAGLTGCPATGAPPSTSPGQTTGSQSDAGVFVPGDTAHDTGAGGADAGAPKTVADFDEPCTSNEDCESGWCVDGPLGFVCSQTCIDECPAGFLCKSAGATGVDITFLCVPIAQKLCEPCLSDAQCYGGFCEAVGEDDQLFCTTLCGEGGSCPAGYECAVSDSVESGRCWPNSGSCGCTVDTPGAKRTCTRVNEAGSCSGWETCEPLVGWAGCNAATPEPELCDGVDNDCNGLADDGLPETQSCGATNEHGTCQGLERCVGGVGWVCDAPLPAPEVCDFSDNDCNGVVDDPFVDGVGEYATVAHCGTCGNACEGKYPFAASVACDLEGASPLCVVDACQVGYFKLSEFQCIVPPDAACKPCESAGDCYGSDCIGVGGTLACAAACAGEEDCEEGLSCLDGHCIPPNGSCDCDESTDGAKKSCSSVNAVGTCFGFQTCDAAVGWSMCDAPEPAVETCDGLDNDCNGAIDDALAPPQCDSQLGVCAGAVQQCGGGAGWLPCGTTTLPDTYEPVELTCDGLDNDCDDSVDEKLVGPACALTLGVCAGVTNVCEAGEYSGCDYGPKYEEEETTCDGLDNDCDGLVDNVDGDGDGFVAALCGGADCDDDNVAVHPAMNEDCTTPADDDCSGLANDKDLDFDGFLDPACGGDDCNDNHPLVHSQAVEVCGDGLDNDCSGLAEDKDIDNDGALDKACGGDDCNDLNPLVYPAAPEVCGDGVDNDCNGVAEDKDTDQDNHIDVACGGDDCNDAASQAHPGLIEVCGDDLDNDCDGSIDNKDIDGDSFLDPDCGGIDCDDDKAWVHPGSEEQCDLLDDDCNGVVDDKDTDGDAFVDIACPGGTDCNDGDVFINPGAKEICGDPNGHDEDCSGADGDKDLDGDGFVDLDPSCNDGSDCDDLDPLVYPDAAEIYDTKDSDCNGQVDEGLVAPGTIVISEIMADPKGPIDGFGEYFEVTNVGILPVNLASWEITDENTPTSDSFALPAWPPVVVPPGGVAVLCRNANPAINGGVTCAAGYDDFILAQGGDEVILSLAGVEIDRVVYGGAGWQKVVAGVSHSLDPNQLSAAGNDIPGHWCLTPPGAQYKLPGGDRGTPGQINPSCSGLPAVTSVSPANGVDNGGESVVLSGSGFIGADTVTIGGNPCDPFEIVDDNTIQCVTPPGNAGDADVVVGKGGQTALLEDGYRFTGEAVTLVDWCDLQWPPDVSVPAGEPTPLIYGQVHAQQDVTAPPGEPEGIIAELGFGPMGSDPRNEPGWSWVGAVWHQQYFANDEYKQTLTVPFAGTWAYGWRFSDDGGTAFMYCDLDPGTADGFQVQKLGILTAY